MVRFGHVYLVASGRFGVAAAMTSAFSDLEVTKTGGAGAGGAGAGAGAGAGGAGAGAGAGGAEQPKCNDSSCFT